jgi:2-phosphosulfolactate phosphatase
VIDVAFTRRELRRADVAVVIDVLRATSTTTRALELGFGEVVLAESVDHATAWRGPACVLAGERNCVRPPGFDLGNSPLELPDGHGRRLVLATTNGAPTVVAAAGRASVVVLACLLNLEAVVDALRYCPATVRGEVQIVCSGTDGAVALEDVYVAGRISAELGGERTDAALVAEAVARAYPSAYDVLAASADGCVLRALDMSQDIAYCARESTIDLLPRLSAASSGAAIVTRDVAGEPRRAASTPRPDRDTVGTS